MKYKFRSVQNLPIEIDESAKEYVKKLMGWDEDDFHAHTFKVEEPKTLAEEINELFDNHPITRDEVKLQLFELIRNYNKRIKEEVKKKSIECRANNLHMTDDIDVREIIDKISGL